MTHGHTTRHCQEINMEICLIFTYWSGAEWPENTNRNSYLVQGEANGFTIQFARLPILTSNFSCAYMSAGMYVLYLILYCNMLVHSLSLIMPAHSRLLHCHCYAHCLASKSTLGISRRWGWFPSLESHTRVYHSKDRKRVSNIYTPSNIFRGKIIIHMSVFCTFLLIMPWQFLLISHLLPPS